MATVTRYVNTASTAGGDGTTNATSGANRAYASLSEWESSEQTNLVTDGDVHVCECDADGDAADTTEVVVDGWTTGSSNDITIQAASGETAVASGWDTARYRLEVTGPTGSAVLILSDDYITLDGLQIGLVAGSGTEHTILFQNLAAASKMVLDSCRIRGDTGVTNRGLSSGDVDLVLDCYNCIIERTNNEGARLNGATIQVFNCTVYNCGTDGFQIDGAANFTAKNTVVFLTSDDFLDNTTGTFTVDYCASDDNDGTNNVAESGGGANWPDDFEDAANGDFTLKSGSGLVGTGTDDPGSGMYSDDINGDARTSTWDVGADEFVAAGGTILPQMMHHHSGVAA